MAGIKIVYSMPYYFATATEVACQFLIILATTILFLAYSCHGHIFSSRHLNLLSPFCYPDMGIHLARTARLLKVGHNQSHCQHCLESFTCASCSSSGSCCSRLIVLSLSAAECCATPTSCRTSQTPTGPTQASCSLLPVLRTFGALPLL